MWTELAPARPVGSGVQSKLCPLVMSVVPRGWSELPLALTYLDLPTLALPKAAWFMGGPPMPAEHGPRWKLGRLPVRARTYKPGRPEFSEFILFGGVYAPVPRIVGELSTV